MSRPMNWCSNTIAPPGYYKKYIRGMRRLAKKHHAKKNREQGKLAIIDDCEPNEVKIVESSKHYYM